MADARPAPERKPSLPSSVLALAAGISPPPRKPSLTSSGMAAAAALTAPPRKPSLTSSGMAAAAALTAPPRKPSLTSSGMAGLLVPTRKPSLTSSGMAAAGVPTQQQPLSPRDRKPSLTSINTGALATGSPPGRGDRKPSLTSVGIAAMATMSASSSPSASRGNTPGTPPTLGHKASSRQLNGPTTPKKQLTPQQQQMLAMRANRRSFSASSSLEQRIDLYFHVPTHKELQRLRVPRTLTLLGLQAMVQRDFAIPFEDQRVYWHGDLLEGDEDLAFYDLHDGSVLNIRVRKRYRPIGDVFSKIKTVKFVSLLKPDEFEIVEVVAPLPPTHIVFKRLVLAINYLQRLDQLQFRTTGRRVWKQRVSFWDEPVTTTTNGSTATATADLPQPPTQHAVIKPTRRTSALVGPYSHLSLPQRRGSTTREAAPQPSEPPSFVMLHSGPERVAAVVSLSQSHAIPQRLQLLPDQRSTSDLRHVKKWLASLKFFASASLPDAALYEVARGCIYTRVHAGDFIFRQGDIGDHFYILISGCVSLAAYGSGYFATLTPGRCFGEISLFEGNGGLRTASATVNFSSAYAELAVLAGDLYRRVINPYKQAVLQHTEKAIFSVPPLRALPDHIVTHVAYASKKLEARHGKRLIRRGEEIRVLVLLVDGQVKVSLTPKAAASSNNSGSTFPVVSVVRAPAVFGQEGCLANTPAPAPWDIDALDHCTLLCLRADTIAIFLAPRPDLIRALTREHTQRLEEFTHRFGQHAAPPSRPSTTSAEVRAASTTTVPPHRASAARLAKLRLLSSKLFESQRMLLQDVPGASRNRRRRGASALINFPKILLRHAEEEPQEEEPQQGRAATAPQPAKPAQLAASPSCAEVQDAFLHKALPYGEILTLRQQIRFVSSTALVFQDQDQRQRTAALLHRLRQLPVEDVAIVQGGGAGNDVYFAPSPRRDVQTR